jgi:fucose 4-O-acetylase-like acetyltransferase
MSRKPRHRYIDRTKGLAILLVVLGHLIAREGPPGPGAEWYLPFKHGIYAFHMPLFMAVSGLVYGLSWKPGATVQEDLADAKRRALRLLPAYLLFGLVIFFGKLAFQSLGAGVDNRVQGPQDLLALLTQPTASFCSFLWYVYALAVLYLVFPLAFRLVRGRVAWLLLAALAIWWTAPDQRLGPLRPGGLVIPATPWFAWDRLQLLSVFFVLGVLAGRHHDASLRWLRRLWLPATAVFAGLLPLAADAPLGHWSRSVVAGASVLAMPGLMRTTEAWRLGVLETLGRYTLIIYLTNTILIGLVKVASIRLGVWQGSLFVGVAAVMTLAATAGPILLKRHLLPRVPALDRITT